MNGGKEWKCGKINSKGNKKKEKSINAKNRTYQCNSKKELKSE
jgi:hypothetical protein